MLTEKKSMKHMVKVSWELSANEGATNTACGQVGDKEQFLSQGFSPGVSAQTQSPKGTRRLLSGC